MTFRILDLFCGAGGAAEGYVRAGFEVVGVDLVRHNAFPGRMVVADALEILDLDFVNVDAVHASPPCQKFSVLNNVHKRDYPDYISAVRDGLVRWGLPYVIENVPGAPLVNPVTVCGSAVGLPVVTCRDGVSRQVRRHRLFETSFPVLVPECQHRFEALGVYGNGPWNNNDKSRRRGGYQGTADERRKGMDIDWMNRDEVAQAIPPAYTELIGRQLADVLKKKRPLAGPYLAGQVVL